jgi:hypothetical protein
MTRAIADMTREAPGTIRGAWTETAVPVQCDMSQVVEVSLRLPARPQLKSPAFPYGIGDVRFTKQAEVQTLPKVGELLTMSAGALEFPCKVVQRNWDETKDMFVLACEYGGSSRISNGDYLTIVEAPDWTAKTLL